MSQVVLSSLEGGYFGRAFFLFPYQRRGIQIISFVQELGIKTKMLKTMSFFMKSLRRCEGVALTYVASA